MSTTEFLGYSLAVNPFPININKTNKIVINTINQYAFCISERDITFKEALQASDILLPDGIGVVKACMFITGKPIKKIAGAEMHTYLLEKLNEMEGKCFYLGSSQGTLDKIRIRMKKEYPLIKSEFYSPPFKKDFTEEDISIMIEKINKFKPNILFLGLTAPKQEKLSYFLKEKVQTNIICSVGAVFDFYAETMTRPSLFWINLNLEWFIRLTKEPKRMWKRYIYYGFIFAYDITKAKLRM